MIEKIEVTQRFNFKRLNRHYECFTLDFVNKNAYYKISERRRGDKFLNENPLCDDSWRDILVDLPRDQNTHDGENEIEIARFANAVECKMLNDVYHILEQNGGKSREDTDDEAQDNKKKPLVYVPFAPKEKMQEPPVTTRFLILHFPNPLKIVWQVYNSTSISSLRLIFS